MNALSKKHFHIVWLPSKNLDWQPFDTRQAAEEAGRELARNNETYSIEEFDTASCPSSACKRFREHSKE